MARAQTKAKRKVTGGRYGKMYRKKRQYEVGSSPIYTKMEDRRVKTVRVGGGNIRQKLLACNVVNLMTKEGKCVQAKIKTVKGNPANKNFVVRNILTKGSIIETDKGKARITNRPGQEGTVNAVQTE